MPRFEIKVTLIVETENVAQATEVTKPLWHNESVLNVITEKARELADEPST